MSAMSRAKLLNNLHKQIDQFISNLEAFNQKREFPRSSKDYTFLKNFYTSFFENRNERSEEIGSPEYAEVKKIANAQFPATTLWNLCMDGRVLAILINGATAGIGSSVRVPGGILREFVYGEDGKLTLLENSNFAFIMRRALKKFKTKKIFEVYDSHIGCAARKGEEMSQGKIPQDAGLLQDVLYKKQMAEATIQFVRKNFSESVNIIPIQTSFDPHTGYLYMGLETENALSFVQEKGGEFTEEVLKELVENNLIIYTEKLITDAELVGVFEKYSFVLDWKKNYVQSAKLFWNNINEFKNLVIPQIKNVLFEVYPHLKEDTKDAEEELLERAMLLLTNAYSGYLHNSGVIDEHEHHKYPYGVHREEGIKVSEGGYPPYEISMFVVFSLDVKNLSANIELAAGLVRSNRREGRVVDRSQIFETVEEFAQAPVPIVVQEVVRDEIDDSEWEIVSQIDWKDLPSNWDTMSEKEFYNYIQRKSNMSIAMANGLNRLRERMAYLYDPEQPTSGRLVQQFKVALPVVVAANRMNYFIVPFTKLGFKAN